MNEHGSFKLDGRQWQAKAKSAASSKPPYPVDMSVTPESVFGDAVWSYPVGWLSMNNRERRHLEFRGSSILSDGSKVSLGDDDPRLETQLKEATWAAIHHRNAFEERRKSRVIKPAGAYEILRKFRRLFLAFKQVGCHSLSEVTPMKLLLAAELLSDTDNGYRELTSAMSDLLVLCGEGYVSDGLPPMAFELPERLLEIEDTSASLGIQPLEDVDVTSIIRASNNVIDNVGLIAAEIRLLRADPRQAQSALQRLRRVVQLQGLSDNSDVAVALTALVHAASANLIMFFAGLRVSEVTSIKSGFVTEKERFAEFDPTRIYMDFVVTKTVSDFEGKSRKLPAHPRLLDVAAALELVRDVTSSSSDFLFVPAGDPLPYRTGAFNRALQRMCDLNGIVVSMSSHRWRKTVASLAVRVLTGSALHLKELFGHQGLAMTARYMMASPFIRAEIQDLTMDEYRKRGRTLLESLAAFGGAGLGGKQGLAMEQRFSALLAADVIEGDLHQSLDEFVDDMMRQGSLPVPVMPGVFCTKPALSVGVCTQTSGDRLADPARCSATCSFQVQTSHRRELVAWTIGQVISRKDTWSPLEQSYWASQCRNQLDAWPDLNDEVRRMASNWPELLRLTEVTANGS